MPTICNTCSVAYKAKKDGVLVIENASFGPYKVWQADLKECPKCGHQVVTGFGKLPLRDDHYANDFPAWLERIKASYSVVIEWNER